MKLSQAAHIGLHNLREVGACEFFQWSANRKIVGCCFLGAAALAIADHEIRSTEWDPDYMEAEMLTYAVLVNEFPELNSRGIKLDERLDQSLTLMQQIEHLNLKEHLPIRSIARKLAAIGL